MSTRIVDSSYTPSEGQATRQQPAAEPRERAREKLALTIPTLREAANIRGLLEHLRVVLDPVEIEYEILVVDDDSRDGTEEIVSSISTKIRACAFWFAKESAVCLEPFFTAGGIQTRRFLA